MSSEESLVEDSNDDHSDHSSDSDREGSRTVTKRAYGKIM